MVRIYTNMKSLIVLINQVVTNHINWTITKYGHSKCIWVSYPKKIRKYLETLGVKNKFKVISRYVAERQSVTLPGPWPPWPKCTIIISPWSQTEIYHCTERMLTWRHTSDELMVKSQVICRGLQRPLGHHKGEYIGRPNFCSKGFCFCYSPDSQSLCCRFHNFSPRTPRGIHIGVPTKICKMSSYNRIKYN